MRRLSIGTGDAAAPARRPRAAALLAPAGHRRAPRRRAPGFADRYAPKKAATVRMDTACSTT